MSDAVYDNFDPYYVKNSLRPVLDPFSDREEGLSIPIRIEIAQPFVKWIQE